MLLKELLEGTEYKIKQGTIEKNIRGISHDSRKINKDEVYICIKGNKVDGHDFILPVIKKGITSIIACKDIKLSDDFSENITIILVKDTRKILSYLAASWYNHPEERLVTIGITGTKGKTTTAYMIKAILEQAGIKTGLIGTIEVLIGNESIEGFNTTPDPLLLQRYLYEMVEAGCTYAVMEVSSQGLKYYRVEGILFDYGIFTNISPDHIGPGEHTDFLDYLQAKAKLFSMCKIGIVNADDKNIDYILKNHTCKVMSYSIQKKAILEGSRVKLENQKGVLGISFAIKGLAKEDKIEVIMPGSFNAYNALAAILTTLVIGISIEQIKQALLCVQVKGRLETFFTKRGYRIIIDYAHNGISLKSVLVALREYHPAKIICLFGCGGNRAKDRRYDMGKISARYADYTIITSDNPRDEQPWDIMKDIIEGVMAENGNYIAICDRRKAIKYCLNIAGQKDIILLAGKGHENYQEIKGIKYHMDEREILKNYLE